MFFSNSARQLEVPLTHYLARLIYLHKLPEGAYFHGKDVIIAMKYCS